MINYLFAREGEMLYPSLSGFYDYIVAANGVFIRAGRLHLQVLVPIMWFDLDLRGLARLDALDVKAEVDHRVPRELVEIMLSASIAAGDQERLFYLNPVDVAPYWKIILPEQEASTYDVHPVQEGAADGVLIEVHSHHHMAPCPSGRDNQDEAFGVRLYAILGRLPERPTIAVRVGAWGYFYDVPAAEIFDLPDDVHDALDDEPEEETEDPHGHEKEADPQE